MTSTSRISHLEEDNFELDIDINIEDVPSGGRKILKSTLRMSNLEVG